MDAQRALLALLEPTLAGGLGACAPFGYAGTPLHDALVTAAREELGARAAVAAAAAAAAASSLPVGTAAAVAAPRTRTRASMSRAEAARLLRMGAFTTGAADALAQCSLPGATAMAPPPSNGRAQESGAGAPADPVRPRVSAHVYAIGGVALAHVTVTESFALSVTGGPQRHPLVGFGGGSSGTLELDADGASGPSAVLTCAAPVGNALAAVLPVDVRSEAPADAAAARDDESSSPDSVLLLRLLHAELRLDGAGSAVAEWMPVSGRSAASSSSSAAAPTAAEGGTVQLRLQPSRSSCDDGRSAASRVITVTRTFVCNVLNDGHMLALALPAAVPAGAADSGSNSGSWFAGRAAVARASAAPLQPDIDVTVHLGGGSGDGSGTPACGLADVTSPSHDARMTHAGADAARLELAAAPTAPGTPPPPYVLLMLEPANVAVLWKGLRGSRRPRLPLVSSASPPQLLPLGMADIAEAIVARATQQQQPSPPPPPSAPPLVLHRGCLPRHIAVVMDGNGRWAKSCGQPRSAGHVAGVDAIHRMIRGCRRLGVSVLTLYAFSAQNWGRPAEEVAALMRLLGAFVATDCEELVANGVRLRVTGDVGALPAGARAGLARLVRASRHNTAGLTLILALSYGGREEIAAAAAAAARAAAAGLLPRGASPADPGVLGAFMPHPDVPDPDLLVRTSGEGRVSNFLLWGIAYTELHVSGALWPDYGQAHLLAALADYARRERRFGKTSAQIAAEAAAAAAAAACGVTSSADAAELPSFGALGRLTRRQLRRLRVAAGAANTYGLSAEDDEDSDEDGDGGDITSRGSVSGGSVLTRAGAAVSSAAVSAAAWASSGYLATVVASPPAAAVADATSSPLAAGSGAGAHPSSPGRKSQQQSQRGGAKHRAHPQPQQLDAAAAADSANNGDGTPPSLRVMLLLAVLLVVLPAAALLSLSVNATAAASRPLPGQRQPLAPSNLLQPLSPAHGVARTSGGGNHIGATVTVPGTPSATSEVEEAAAAAAAAGADGLAAAADGSSDGHGSYNHRSASGAWGSAPPASAASASVTGTGSSTASALGGTPRLPGAAIAAMPARYGGSGGGGAGSNGAQPQQQQHFAAAASEVSADGTTQQRA